MSNFSEWYMRVEDDDLGSVHDCVWDDDYCKARDVQSILEEAFEAGYDKAGARVKELESALKQQVEYHEEEADYCSENCNDSGKSYHLRYASKLQCVLKETNK
jgi:hypothetical protein